MPVRRAAARRLSPEGDTEIHTPDGARPVGAAWLRIAGALRRLTHDLGKGETPADIPRHLGHEERKACA